MDKKVLKNEQNKQFNIEGAFSAKPILRMNENELNDYLEKMGKYSPLFQGENLYQNSMKPEEIVKILSENKIYGFIEDYISLNPKFNAYIALCSNIVTKIQANEDQYQKISKDLYGYMLNDELFKEKIIEVETVIENKINEYKQSESFSKDVEKFINENKSITRESAENLVLNKYLTELSREEVDKIVNENFEKIVDGFNKKPNSKIEYKDENKTAKNDYIVMGAPASGKGGITSTLFSDSERANSIVLNPDSYRVFTENLIENKFTNDEIKMNNMAITPEFAYLTQVGVMKQIKNRQNELGVSVISDKATYEKEIESALKTSAEIVMAAYYGQPTYSSGVTYRNVNRADNAQDIIDKRYFNSDAILGIHKNYFNNFIKNNSPFKFDVKIIDVVGKDLTGERGQPKTIATISSKTQELEIKDPVAFIEFVAKSDMNENAKHPIEVFRLNKNYQEKLDSKVKAFESFCSTAESRGVTIKDKENVISSFVERENRIVGRLNQPSSNFLNQSR